VTELARPWSAVSRGERGVVSRERRRGELGARWPDGSSGSPARPLDLGAGLAAGRWNAGGQGRLGSGDAALGAWRPK
jgi:hypothetical protein